MPNFGRISKARLATCHPDIQKLFNEVIKHFDCVIIEGNRDPARQQQLVEEGKSRTLNSKHLHNPSLAVDVAPYPVNWSDTNRMRYFAGVVQGVALQMGIKIRWGGDWNQDTEVSDNTFNDLVHYELDS